MADRQRGQLTERADGRVDSSNAVAENWEDLPIYRFEVGGEPSERFAPVFSKERR
jgi:hypothetical protein